MAEGHNAPTISKRRDVARDGGNSEEQAWAGVAAGDSSITVFEGIAQSICAFFCPLRTNSVASRAAA
jgi:hypothetical protein